MYGFHEVFNHRLGNMKAFSYMIDCSCIAPMHVLLLRLSLSDLQSCYPHCFRVSTSGSYFICLDLMGVLGNKALNYVI